MKIGLLSAVILAGVFCAGAQTFENRFAHWEIGEDACVSRLWVKPGGYQLVKEKIPFVAAANAKGEIVPAVKCEAGEKELRFTLKDGGKVTLAVTAFDGGWTFETKDCELKDAESLWFVRLRHATGKYFGALANAVSDDNTALFVRGYEAKTEMYCAGEVTGSGSENHTFDGAVNGSRIVCAGVMKKFGFNGHKAGLAAARRNDILSCMRAMTIVAGAPHSTAGGAWAMDSESNRGSYLFATSMDLPSLDDWISLMERGGFDLLHFHVWWKLYGSYEVDTYCFPNGYDDIKAAAEKVRKAGFRSGTHTLSACIEWGSKCLTPECDTNLVSVFSYTLAKPFKPGDAEFYVNEEIWKGQQEHFVGTMGTVKGRGNTFRIGRELVQYSGVDRKAKKFTGVKRGVYKCRRGEYPVKVAGTFRPGEKVDYLRSCYSAFYPVPDSPLMDRTAEAIDKVFNHCGMEEIYFDGSEGMGTRYDVDRMRENIFRMLNQGPNGIVNEASCMNAYHWWFRSRLWPWDHNWYGARRLHDLHTKMTLDLARNSNFLGCNLGWWAPLAAAETGRGHFLDEMEYYMCKNAAYDSSMSMQGMYVTDGPLSFNVEKQATLMGWWERARMARAFADGLQKKMQPYGEEFRLRQNGEGLWEVTPVKAAIHRAGTPEAMAWKVKADKAKKAELRVEALYGIKEKYDSKAAKAYFTPGAKVEITTAANVNGEVKTADSEKGRVFTISAANAGKTSRGAWLGAVEHHEYPNLVFVDGAFGTWVYGDGSGAILNFNLKLHRFNWGGRSEHYVRLDFKGWRYVTFLLRERDADWFGELDWPYAKNWADARTVYNGPYWTSEPTIEFVGAWLNEIPAGGKTEVRFTELRSLGITRPALEGAVVTVNGTDIKVPFRMAAGDFAELANGVWELYDEMGDVKARRTTGDKVGLKAGENAVAFRGRATADRAEITLTALGEAIPAYTDKIAEADAKWLKYEAAIPQMFAPAKGFDQPVEVVTRPGEKAQLTLDVWGPIDTPVFEIDGVRYEFPVKLGKLDHLICRDGRNWRVEHVVPGATKDEGGIWYKVAPSGRKELKKGTLTKAFPEIEGTKTVKVSSKDAAKAEARIEFAKRYSKVKSVPDNPRAIKNARDPRSMTVPEITEGVTDRGETVEVAYPQGGFALKRNTAGGNATDWKATVGKGRTCKQKAFVVPPSLYRTAKIVMSVDPDRNLDRVFTVRFTRYNDGCTFGGRDFEGMANIRVDFDKAEKRQLADGRWEVTVPLDLGKIADLVNGRDVFGTWLCNSLKMNGCIVRKELGNYLDFEILSRLNDPAWRSPMQDARMIPDSAYTSALTVYSAVLEKGPAGFDWRCAQPGNVFHNDEKPVTCAVVDAKRPVTLTVTISDAEGNKVSEKAYPVNAGRQDIEIDLAQEDLGWHSLVYELSDAKGVFMRHEASFALLGKDTRTMKDGEGPYGTWTYSGNHYQDTNFHNVGSLMLKAGLRKGEGVTWWTKEIRSKYLVGPQGIGWNRYQ
ncbi:MAG: hypothetical protein PHV28_09285, partial [Kiritimatiellae bacterium]|nr:hypothetical protein [Kiritimatiellia bacterium]